MSSNNDPRLANLLAAIRSIRREAIDQQAFGVPGCEFCREVVTVARTVEGFSHGAHAWSTELVRGVHVGKQRRQFLIVGYSNPGTGIPNHIVSMFPVNPAPGKMLACLNPLAMTQLSGALYWRDGKLIDDWFIDRTYVCVPLERQFGLPHMYADPDFRESDPTGRRKRPNSP